VSLRESIKQKKSSFVFGGSCKAVSVRQLQKGRHIHGDGQARANEKPPRRPSPWRRGGFEVETGVSMPNQASRGPAVLCWFHAHAEGASCEIQSKLASTLYNENADKNPSHWVNKI
jgi:hypothetical protein